MSANDSAHVGVLLVRTVQEVEECGGGPDGGINVCDAAAAEERNTRH